MATILFTGTVRLLCKPTFGRQWHHCYCRGTIMLIKNTRAAGAIAARPRFLRSSSSSWSVSTSGKYQYHTSNARPSSNAASGPLNLGSDHLIESWFHEVKTFGSLTVNDVPFDVHIQPLNPMEYPIAHKSIVQMFYDVRQAPGGEGPLPGQKLSDMSKVYDLKVLVDDGGNNMDVKCDLPAGVQLPVVCVITVPLKFGVYEFDIDYVQRHQRCLKRL
ncbi:hypothetical protein BaRGS_00018765 [Batillaria attramentaria]|uniref:Uncharacterized protein n=1 Tax=Batillaria attramentaria TaxID=370345 RepID=A0ABD0KRX8_9CAEN